VTKLKKGDLVRTWAVDPACKGLVIEDKGALARRRLVKVLWMTGYWKGERTWESPNYLAKMEVESA
jgi:hypothetical protein